MATTTVRVQCGGGPGRAYDVVVGAEWHQVGAMIAAACPGATRAAVVVDLSLRGTTAALTHSLKDGGFAPHVVDGLREAKSGEGMKSLANVECICTQFAAAGLDRRDLVIAVGGGIIGDLAGFAAAVYRRGISWVNVPTTLLAMVDASVGGKTGANLFDGSGPGSVITLKNMIGAFHQPSLVVIDPAWLLTLPPREVACGLAECIKHGMLCRSVGGSPDVGLFSFTADVVRGKADLARDLAVTQELISRNVALKARVVEGDELEMASDAAGGRALLNLGHTYAHVIEGVKGPAVLHGEAVALGLVAASHAARAMGRVGQDYVKTVTEVVAGAGLATAVAGLPESTRLAELMRGDKKTLGGRLRLVLPMEPSPGEVGHAGVVTDPPLAAVIAGWESLRS